MTDHDGVPAGRDTDQQAGSLPVQRRTYMTLFAAGAVAASAAGPAQGGSAGQTATDGDVSPTTSHGYGQGGYGTVPYGGGQAGPPPIVGNDNPTDPDGDGLYEDIDGSGDFTIFDVQALFSHLNDPAVQNNAQYYRFQEGNTGSIGVFDVQALFNKL